MATSVLDSGAFQETAQPKVYSGGAWVPAAPKVYNGNEWIECFASGGSPYSSNPTRVWDRDTSDASWVNFQNLKNGGEAYIDCDGSNYPDYAYLYFDDVSAAIPADATVTKTVAEVEIKATGSTASGAEMFGCTLFQSNSDDAYVSGIGEAKTSFALPGSYQIFSAGDSQNPWDTEPKTDFFGDQYSIGLRFIFRDNSANSDTRIWMRNPKLTVHYEKA